MSDTDPAQIAESERAFPPPTIASWVRYGGVSLTNLRDELRYWTDFVERWLEEGRTHA